MMKMTKMMKMMNAKQLLTVTVLTTLLSLTPVWAQDDDDIDALQINKDSIEQGIAMLEQSGQLSPEQAKAAREELKNKSNGEIEALKMQAIERVKSGNIPTLPQQVPASTSAVTAPAPSVAVESTLAPASVTVTTAPTAAAAVVPTPAPAPAAANNDAKLKEALKFLDSGK